MSEPETDVVYLCDGHGCRAECADNGPSGTGCKHTRDVAHAVNFVNLGDEHYEEIEWDEWDEARDG